MAKKTSKTVSDKAASDKTVPSPKAASAARPAGSGNVASADTDKTLFIGKGDQSAFLTLGLANRHGLVTGATGTGKTVTLQVMAEGFARAGVPVFAADIKGDLSGIAEVGEAKDLILSRAKDMGLQFQPDQFSTVFWDVFGEQGHPVRATVTEMGPLLLSQMLQLNDVQEGVLNVAFRVADEHGLALVDMKDLRALLDAIVPGSAKDADLDPLRDIRKAAQSFGNVSKATVGTIQRQLLVLENQGADKFFGEPALQLKDFMRTDSSGRGMVNILVADKLMSSPKLYSTFLLWMLSELFEDLPEVGDPAKPKLVFFFDEAHLLFDDAPKALMDKIEQVVRLIRSKGIGVYFVTQNPIDVPDKSHVGPLRLLDILALTYLLFSAPAVGRFCRHPSLRLIDACGRHSLEIFAAGCMAALIGRILYRTFEPVWPLQIAVNLGGFAVMLGLGLALDARARRSTLR